MRRCLSLALVVAHSLWLVQPTPARADPAHDEERAAREEARSRFDRGVALFEHEHDPAGALAELRRAYELVPVPQTLFLLGLVYAAMNRPVEALAALEEVVRAPGELTSAQRALAAQRRDEQKLRVGYLRLSCAVPAVVEVDGVPQGPLRAGEPLAVAAGLRVLTVEAPGFLAFRKEISVAGATTVAVVVSLEAHAEARHAVRVVTNVPDATVWLDGTARGRTPLAGPLWLAPGEHRLEAKRDCYADASRSLTVSEAVPVPDAVALRLSPLTGVGPCPPAALLLATSEPGADTSVDDEPPSPGARPIPLPAGRHAVRVQRTGFLPVEGMVDLRARETETWMATLAPTAETRERERAHAFTQRRWGQGLVVGGGAVTLLAVVATAITWGRVSEARDDRERVFHTFDPGASCNPGSLTYVPACENALSEANQNVHRKELARGLSLGALAVGVAAGVAGAVLILAGSDPDRYDKAPPPGLRRVGLRSSNERGFELTFASGLAEGPESVRRAVQAGVRLTF